MRDAYLLPEQCPGCGGVLFECEFQRFPMYGVFAGKGMTWSCECIECHTVTSASIKLGPTVAKPRSPPPPPYYNDDYGYGF